MGKLIYLFELDSVRKTNREIEIGQQTLYEEIVKNGNVVVLTYNQLVDSRGFFSLIDISEYYDNLIALFENGSIRISQFGDTRTIAQYLINSLAYERNFIFSGWPLKSTQKRLLALIKRSLIYSDLTEINDYQNIRSKDEIIDLFVELDNQQQEHGTAFSVQQCKDILENLFWFLKTVLRLSAMHTIYVNPKPVDHYGMTLPKYIHNALSLIPTSNHQLWNEAKDIILSLKDVYEGIVKRDVPVFIYDKEKGSIDRSDYHHAIKHLYERADSPNITAYQYAEAIVDICYNYQLEYSICNSSKHYNLSEFDSENPKEWVTFASDFFARLEQLWSIGDNQNRFLLNETNVFDEFEMTSEVPDFSKALRMTSYVKKDYSEESIENIKRYEYETSQQKSTRKRKMLSSIRKKVLFSVICFVIALSIEVIFELIQNELDGFLNNIFPSVVWVALEVLLILGVTEFITSKIHKKFPDFLQLSDALNELGSLWRDNIAIHRMFKQPGLAYANPCLEAVNQTSDAQKGIHIDFVKSDAMKRYIRTRESDKKRHLFSESTVYPLDSIQTLKATDTQKKLSRLEEIFGYQFGNVYQSRFNTVMVDPIQSDSIEKPYYPYERVVPSSEKDGVVMIPKCGEKYILIKQYRHAIRNEQHSFPRGYAEDGDSPEQNALRELKEELGVTQISSVNFLNRVAPDSGLTSCRAYVYCVEFDKYNVNLGHEGILDIVELTESEVNEWIQSGKIDDGFTLSAWALLKSHEN